MSHTEEQLSQEGFEREEVKEILRRAAELQGRAEQPDERLTRSALEAGAEGAGIAREFIDEAIRQMRAERAEQQARREQRRRMAVRIGVPVAVVLFLLGLISHRSLNTRMAEVETRRAQLDNVLQRRHDLIPNLIAVTKASATQQQELAASLQALVGQIRQAGSPAQRQQLEEQLDRGVRELMAALRADPDTASTAMFTRLSDEMAGAENRIAVERKRYNEAAAAYNRAARSFPTFLLRPFLGFPASQPYFEASDAARQVPAF